MESLHKLGRIVPLAAAMAVVPASAVAQQTIAADRFVDSVGVNIHLHYTGSVYTKQFPLLRERLIELGVRHVRDGLVDSNWRPYFERHNSLGEAGIKGTFITAPEQSTELWAGYPARMSKTFEAYEAPNEYNIKARKPNWAQILTETVKRLHTLKDIPGVAHFPIYGPSLTTAAAYAALGDLSAYYDFANLHNYFGGRHPGTRGWGRNGYGSIAWNLDLVRRYAQDKPVVTTETGYWDTASLDDWVPREVAGRYMPRVLLEQFQAGIVRTYLYELVDYDPSGGTYGLLNGDGSPKPAFTAVKSLLNLLTDRGPAFTPKDLAYSIRSGTQDVRHMAFQKRNGTYFLALWLARPSFNQTKRQSIAVSEQSVVVVLPQAMRHVRTHRWQLDGSLATTTPSSTTTTIPVSVADSLTMIELAPVPTGPRCCVEKVR